MPIEEETWTPPMPRAWQQRIEPVVTDGANHRAVAALALAPRGALPDGRQGAKKKAGECGRCGATLWSYHDAATGRQLAADSCDRCCALSAVHAADWRAVPLRPGDDAAYRGWSFGTPGRRPFPAGVKYENQADGYAVPAAVWGAFLDRHCSGDHGLYGDAAGLVLSEPERFAPALASRLARNVLAAEGKNGVVRSRFTRPGHAAVYDLCTLMSPGSGPNSTYLMAASPDALCFGIVAPAPPHQPDPTEAA